MTALVLIGGIATFRGDSPLDWPIGLQVLTIAAVMLVLRLTRNADEPSKLAPKAAEAPEEATPGEPEDDGG